MDPEEFYVKQNRIGEFYCDLLNVNHGVTLLYTMSLGKGSFGEVYKG